MSSATFPVKLHQLLCEVEKDGQDRLISWLPGGESFKVHEKELFATELMPSYFGTSKYRSFQKNLNMWGFTTVRGGARRGTCSHPLFVRGMLHLCHRMVRHRGFLSRRTKDDEAESTTEPGRYQSVNLEIPTRNTLSSHLPPGDVQKDNLGPSSNEDDDPGVSNGNVTRVKPQGGFADSSASVKQESLMAALLPTAQLAAGTPQRAIRSPSLPTVTRCNRNGLSPVFPAETLSWNSRRMKNSFHPAIPFAVGGTSTPENRGASSSQASFTGSRAGLPDILQSRSHQSISSTLRPRSVTKAGVRQRSADSLFLPEERLLTCFPPPLHPGHALIAQDVSSSSSHSSASCYNQDSQSAQCFPPGASNVDLQKSVPFLLRDPTMVLEAMQLKERMETKALQELERANATLLQIRAAKEMAGLVSSLSRYAQHGNAS